MRKITTLIECFFALLFTSTAMAQNAQDACGCNGIFPNGIYNHYSYSGGNNYKSSLKIIFDHDYTFWSTDEWKKDNSIQSGGNYLDIISGFFDGNMSSSEKAAKYETMRNYFKVNQDISQEDYKFISQQFIDDNLVNKWNDCMKTCIGADQILLDKQVSGNEFTITLYWKHRNTTDVQHVTSISPINAELEPGGTLIRNGQIKGQGSYTSTFKIKDIHQDATVKIDVSAYSTDPILVPAVEVANEMSNSPIGTIIVSVLPWDLFCEINHFKNVIDYTKSKWVPADGRSVANSQYGKKINNVPDLRGVFLRGMNDFGAPNPNVNRVNGQQADPDVNRTAGNGIQPDALQGHRHNISLSDPRVPPPGGINGFVQDNNHNPNLQLGGALAFKATNVETDPNFGDVRVANETRPKNIAVYYYIKIN